MVKLSAQEELIAEVCDIVGHHHHPRPGDTVNFKVVYDADLIENLDENLKANPAGREKLAEKLERLFLTAGGREIAKEVLLPE